MTSPWSIFFADIRFWPWCPGTSSGGNTECIPISIVRKKWLRWSYELLLFMPTKSYKNTFRRLMNDYIAVSQWLVESCAMSSMQFLKGCSGRLTYCRTSSITSHAVSEAVQNKYGYLHHPICRQFCMTMLISPIYLGVEKDVITYPKFHAPSLLTFVGQNPFLMSIFAKRNGLLRLWLSAKVDMSLFTHGPNFIMNSSGACLMVV